MIMFRCGRCGGIYDSYYGSYGRWEDDFHVANAIATALAYSKKNTEIVENIRLCPNCMRSFNHWLLNPEEDLDERMTDEDETFDIKTFAEAEDNRLKNTTVTLYDVWEMLTDMVMRGAESIDKMDKERKRNG